MPGRLLLRRNLLPGHRPHAGNALFDVSEFRAVAAIARPSRQSGDFRRHRLGSIPGIRMVAEKLGSVRAAFLLDLVKEIGHGSGIEAAVIHDVGAEQVSFGFRFPGILQKVGAEAKRQPHLRHLRERTLTHDSTQDGQRQLRRHLFAGRSRSMPLDDVRDFVRHHACQLGFVVRRLNASDIYKDRVRREEQKH